MNITKYYTLRKQPDNYIIWLNIEIHKSDIGSVGCYKKFEGTLRECKKYCNKNKIKIRGKNYG